MTRLLAVLSAFFFFASTTPALGLGLQSADQGGGALTDHRALAEDLAAKHRWLESEKEFRIYRNEHPDSVNAIVWHAEALMRISQPFDAALELQKFIGAHPDSVRALELHAVLASSSLHDPKGAEADLEECVKLDAKDFFARKSLGDIYLDQDRGDEAVRSYEAAVKLRPQDPVVRASLAYARSRTNAHAEAESDFKEAARMARAPAEVIGVQTLYGRFLLDDGNKEMAVAAFGKVLAVDPHSAEALIWRAEAYTALQMMPQAEADALAALAQSPGDKRSALLLVKLYRQQGMPEKAEQYAGVVQKIAAAEDAHFALGRNLRDTLGEVEPLLLKGDYKEAAVRYETIVKTLPTFYEAYFDLGMCYSQMGRLAEAEAGFRKYLSYQPVSGDGHASLGILLVAEGRGAEAIPELKEAIQIDPSLTEARKFLANEYIQQSNFKAAIAVLRPAEKEKDAQLLVLLALALKNASMYAGALDAVNTALELQPGDAQATQIKKEILAATEHR